MEGELEVREVDALKQGCDREEMGEGDGAG